MDMILSQFDKGSLPSDIEELATICRVRVSEFESFKQVFEQVLKHKFKQNLNGRLENDVAKEIIQRRQQFKEKRSEAGKLSYIIRYFIKTFKPSIELIQYIKDNIQVSEIDTKNEQELKQVFKQMSELYININTISFNKEYVSFLEILNKITNKKFRGSSKDKTSFNARMKEGYSLSDFETAITNCKNDKYHIDNPQYLTPEFITRSDKLQKYLNVSPTKNMLIPNKGNVLVDKPGWVDDPGYRR
jgi:uncharacterized phage protein (TIGR02220 family)